MMVLEVVGLVDAGMEAQTTNVCVGASCDEVLGSGKTQTNGRGRETEETTGDNERLGTEEAMVRGDLTQGAEMTVEPMYKAAC